MDPDLVGIHINGIIVEHVERVLVEERQIACGSGGDDGYGGAPAGQADPAASTPATSS